MVADASDDHRKYYHLCLNLFDTAIELDSFPEQYHDFYLVPLRLETEADLVCSDRLLQAGLNFIEVLQIAHGIHYMYFRLVWSQFILFSHLQYLGFGPESP